MGTLVNSLRAMFCVWTVTLPAWLLPPDDPWAAGSSLEEWGRITKLQRYPLYDAKAPDAAAWAAACKDANPLVRTAAALAVGRAGDGKLLPLIIPLLADESTVTRRSALWALTQLESQDIKEALLKVLNSWGNEDVEASRFLSSYLGRIGLPRELAHMQLPARQAWLKKFDSSAWHLTSKPANEPLAPGDEGSSTVVGCLENSEADAGEPIPMRIRLTRTGGKRPFQYTLSGGSWYAIDPEGRPSHNDLYEYRFGGVGKRLTVPADGSMVSDEPVVTAKKPLPPGVYLLEACGSPGPLLVRMRRSAVTEREIPELIKNADDRKVIQRLGEQRVRAAVPALIEALRAHAQKRDGRASAAANALGRIGDPAAVPALLQQKSLQNVDVIGDTSGALRAIGPAAYPVYDENIGNWKDLLAGEKTRILAQSLRLRGPGGPVQLERARLALLEHFAKEKVDFAKDKLYGPLEVFQAVVATTAARHPDKTVEAIWATRSRPDTFASLINGFHRKRPVYGRVWSRRVG